MGNRYNKGGIPWNKGLRGIKKAHGLADSHFYKKWQHMKYRCECISCERYKNYGGRGIKICNEWRDFKNFKKDMYEGYLKHVKKFGKKNTTLDRINNNKNYFKENCKWSNNKEQTNNSSRNVFIIFKNKKMTIIQWAEKLLISPSTLYARLDKLRWSEKRALTAPVRKIIKTLPCIKK